MQNRNPISTRKFVRKSNNEIMFLLRREQMMETRSCAAATSFPLPPPLPPEPPRKPQFRSLTVHSCVAFIYIDNNSAIHQNRHSGRPAETRGAMLITLRQTDKGTVLQVSLINKFWGKRGSLLNHKYLKCNLFYQGKRGEDSLLTQLSIKSGSTPVLFFK